MVHRASNRVVVWSVFLFLGHEEQGWISTSGRDICIFDFVLCLRCMVDISARFNHLSPGDE